MAETECVPIRVRDEDAQKQLVKYVGMTVFRLDTGATEIFGADGQWYPAKARPAVRQTAWCPCGCGESYCS